MTFLFFILSFLLLVVVGSRIINGFFLVTRGEWVDDHRGLPEKSGMLLKGWWFFWFKTKGVDYPVISGDALIRIVSQMAEDPAMDQYRIRKSTDPLYQEAVIADKSLLGRSALLKLKDTYGLIASRIQERDRELVNTIDAFYELRKEQPVYVFPEKIRTVMAGCITCHASVYGSLIYWLAVWLFGFAQFRMVSEYPVALSIITWFAYMFTLAYENTRLWAKRNG